MDQQSEQTLARLIRETRIAALGTVHDGEPNLAVVAYAFAEDFSAFYIHVSRPGKHTTNGTRHARQPAHHRNRRPPCRPADSGTRSMRGMNEILTRTVSGYDEAQRI